MDNPILVEVTRGDLVESFHRGAFAVVDAAGQAVQSAGDIDRPVFPRSAVKALQALPMVESGAADAFGYGAAELALACSSHNGEPRHVETALRMLVAAGLGEGDLECGAHAPRRSDDQAVLHRSGRRPGPATNNCSGKHSGMLALACRCGWETRGYVGRSHPVQREVRAAIEDVCGTAASEDACGTDGCSIPTWALPLRALARGFARFGSGEGLGPERAKAAARLRAAVAAEPFYVAGTGRFCTEIMGRLGERVFVKTGAEGVFCAAIPSRGLGVALKIDDGAGRAAEVAMAALIGRLAELSPGDEEALARWTAPRLSNWKGLPVGEIRPAGPLLAARA